MSLREQFELETGQDPYPCLLGELHVHTDYYVAWIENRVEAAEKLAKSAKHVLDILRLQPSPKLGGWNWPEIANDLQNAIAKYEKGKQS